jgi:hypothetical protein
MVVHDLDVLGTGGSPPETNAKPIVYPNAVLPFSVAFQRFEPVPRGNSQVVEPTGDFQLPKLATRD